MSTVAEMSGPAETVLSDVEQTPHRPVKPVPVPNETPGTTEDQSAEGAASIEPSGAVAGAVAGDDREAARSVWRERAAAGEELSGRELGALFDRSERWGRDRITEVRPKAPGKSRSSRRRGGPGTASTSAGNGTRPGRHDGTSATDDTSANGATSETGTHAAGAVAEVAGGCGDPQPGAVVPGAVVPVPSGSARLVAWCGFLFGTVISVAANVLYSWLPALAGEAGAPGLAPQVGAAVWPITLVISVEVLSRVRWPAGWTWQVARYGGAGVVAFGAAVISYGHLHGVLAAWDYGTVGALVGPLVIDGLMTVSGFALLALGGHGTAARR